MPKGEWTPPEAGNAPAEVRHILKVAYAAYRDKHGGEDPATKAAGAKRAWAAVKAAGFRKNKSGRWVKRKRAKSMVDVIAELWSKEFGGEGSGNWGHAGRPGERGGSMPGGGGVSRSGVVDDSNRMKVDGKDAHPIYGKKVYLDGKHVGYVRKVTLRSHIRTVGNISHGVNEDKVYRAYSLEGKDLHLGSKRQSDALYKLSEHLSKTQSPEGGTMPSGVPAKEEKGTTAGGTFYHGTIAPRVEKIKAQGLKEGSIHNYDKKVNTLSGKGAVFMSSSRTVAKRYAADLSFTRNSTPAIIEIRVPKGQKLQFDKLPETREYGKGTSYYKLGRVPPEWIKSVKVYVGAGRWEEMAEQTEGEGIYFVVIGIAPFEKENAIEAPKQFGGQGSGNWGHAGRPGERGGSAPGDGPALKETTTTQGDVDAHKTLEPPPEDINAWVKWKFEHDRLTDAASQTRFGLKDETLRLWTEGSNDFKILQTEAEMAARSRRENEIVSAIRDREVDVATIYRGIHTKEFSEDSPHLKWREGDTVQLFPQSFSKDKEIGVEFALKGERRENAIVFVINKGGENIHGVDITGHRYSFHSENEVITGGHFRVDKYEKKPPSWPGSKEIHYFYLTQIGVF